MAGPQARRRHRRRAVHPLRRQHAGAVRETGAADDRPLPGRYPAPDRQAGLRRRLRAERQAQPEDHCPLRREGTVRPAGFRRRRYRGRCCCLCFPRPWRTGREDGTRLPRPFVLQRGRDRRLRPSPERAEVAQDRRHAAAHRQDHGRWQPGGLVPGPYGVRSTRPGRSLDHRLPERAAGG
ncbi:hypothetical protein D3C76_1281360 [compost metagenome]